MSQVQIDEGLKAQVRDYLEKQGYGITEGAKLLGKSGIEHTFDMLAQKDDGFTTYNIAICVIAGGDMDSEVAAIFSFANNIHTTEGGTHLSGFKSGLTRSINQFCKSKNLL